MAEIKLVVGVRGVVGAVGVGGVVGVVGFKVNLDKLGTGFRS